MQNANGTAVGASNELLWIGTGSDGQHLILCGYPTATLMAGPSGPSIGFELFVATGAAAPAEIIIHADTLYLQPGATYDFPGKNVTIVARQLGMVNDTNDAATISVTGGDGDAADPTPPAPLKLPRPDKRSEADGRAGDDGKPGLPGAPGGDGGRFTLKAYELLSNLNLKVVANGGSGGDGANGQDGQDGQDGAEGDSETERTGANDKGHPHTITWRKTNPGDGGRGGAGGDGGKAGNGGEILIESASATPSGDRIQCSADPGWGGRNGFPGDNGKSGEDPNHPDPDDSIRPLFPVPIFPTSQPRGAVGKVDASYGVRDETFAPALNADHVALLLSRLRFTYLTLMSMPALGVTQDPAHVQARKARLQNFSDVLGWLNQLVPKAGGDASLWAAARTALDDLSHKVANHLDAYGNRLDTVPDLNPDASELARAVGELAEAEKLYFDVLAAMDSYAADKTKLANAFAAFASKLKTDEEAATAALTEIKGARLAIKAAHDRVLAAYDVLIKGFDREIAAVAGGDWNTQGLLASIGSALMFVSPEFSIGKPSGAAFVAGAALSVASNYDASRFDAGGSLIGSDYLINRVQDIEASVRGLQQGWTGTKGSFLTGGGGNTLLVADRQKFNEFLDQYFPSDRPLRSAMDSYLNAVQDQNTAVVQYNDWVSKYLSARLDELETNNAKALAAANLETLNAPGLTQLARLASHAYASKVQAVLYQFYEFGRALVCLNLKASAALDTFAELNSVSDLTADVFSMAIATLHQELSAYRSSLSTNMVSEVDLSFTWPTSTAANAADLLARVRKERRVTLFLDPDRPFFLDGIDKAITKGEIRAVAVKAHLIGVEGDGIQVDIVGGGRCKVVPADGVSPPVVFDIPEVTQTNVFDAHAGQITDTSVHTIAGTEMRWGGDSGTEVLTAPLRGLYSDWTLKIPGHTSLDGLTQIRLTFTVQYRAFEAKATLHPLLGPATKALGVGGGLVPTAFRSLRFSLSSVNLSRAPVRNFYSFGTPFTLPVQRARSAQPRAITDLQSRMPLAGWPDYLRANPNETTRLVRAIADSRTISTSDQGTLIYNPSADERGHLGILDGVTLHGDAAPTRIRDPLFAVRGPFAAFPNGVSFLPPELGPDYLNTKDRAGFLKNNRDVIDRLAVELYTQAGASGRLSGIYFLLGSDNVVRCVQHELVEHADGSVTLVLHLQTTSQHIFDGTFVWSWRWTPEMARYIRFIGLQVGKHNSYTIDRFNVSLGPVLAYAVNECGVDFLNARERGEPALPGDPSIIADSRLRLLHAGLAAGDGEASWFLRARDKANTRAETYELTDNDLVAIANGRSLEDLPLVKADQPGIFVDGTPVYPSENIWGDRMGPPGSEQMADVMQRLLEYTLSQAAYERIRDEVLKYAAEQTGSDLANKSGSDLLAQLMEEPRSRLHLEGIIRAQLFEPMLASLESISGSVAADPADTPDLLRDAEQRFREQLTIPMLSESGALHAAVRLQILDDQMATLDRAAVGTKLSDALARREAARASIERLTKVVPANEEERAAIERQLDEQAAAEEVARGESERYTEQASDLDHYAEKREETAALEKEARQSIFERERKASAASKVLVLAAQPTDAVAVTLPALSSTTQSTPTLFSPGGFRVEGLSLDELITVLRQVP